MKITLNQLRFLIVWFAFNSFALIVNLVDIRAELPNGNISLFTSRFSYNYKDDFWPFTKFYKTSPIWKEDINQFKISIDTSKVAKLQTGKEKAESAYLDSLSKTPSSTSVTSASRRYIQVGEQNYYGGLFNSYGIPEYIFYICLGAAIVFIPKLWKP